ncbi:MAG: redoxin domain-containing protein [Ferruginibacter sp.]|nr:redoxin domain-containing protein [Ferruginibacter sp.]
MKNALYGIKAAWRAEFLKLKGSRIILMTCIMGLILPLLYNFITVMAKFYADFSAPREKLPYNILLESMKEPLFVFGSFFFPLTLILVTSRLATLEHKSDTWKLVETQPVSRFSFWIVKWSMAASMSLLAIFIYFLSTLLFTFFLYKFDLYDKYAYVKIPFHFMATAGIRVWISSLGIITLQLTVSMLLRSTIWPIVIGVIMLLITNISMAMSSAFASIWPYALPFTTSQQPDGSEIGNWLLPSEKQGIVWLLLIPLAFLLYRYRISFRQSFKNKSLWALSIVCLILLGFATWWLQQPKTLPVTPGRTIIAGIIKADKLPDSIEVMKMPIGSEKTVVQKDGSFHFNLKLASDIEKLTLSISRAIDPKIIYAGDGDSIFVDWTQGKSSNLQSIKLTGTAIATNSFVASSERPISRLQFYIVNPDFAPDINRFYSILVREWEEQMEKLKKFKTADGLGLSNTVREMQEKLITADYLNIALYQYPDKRNIDLSSPEFEKIKKNLKPLEDKLKPFEEKLVGWKAYNDFLYLQITRNLPAGLNADSAFYATIMQKPPGAMRNAIMFDFAKKRIQVARDSASRAAIMQEMVIIDNQIMQEDLKKGVELLNRVRKGKPAPFIAIHNDKMEQVNFSMLKGRYIVIDVWATWCEPCLDIAPVFERMSEKYRNSPITFMSLSIDDDLSAWQQHIKRKKNRITQWRVANRLDLLQQYGIESIPHFILLDPDGNFINANFPRADEGNFEIQLRQALKLPAEEG